MSIRLCQCRPTEAPRRTRWWGERFYRLLLDEYLDTVEDARRHGFQAWLVKETGIKRSTIGTWWASKRQPDLVSLAKIRRALRFLEVGSPAGYDGPWNYSAFRECVERYYRALVGEGGRMINLGPGSAAAILNVGFQMEMGCTFEAPAVE